MDWPCRHNIVLQIGLLSLSPKFSDFLPLTAYVIPSLLLLQRHFSTGLHPILLTPSTRDGHLGHSHAGVIRDTELWISAYKFLSEDLFPFLWDINLPELLGHKLTLHLTFGGTTQRFAKQLLHCTFPGAT